MLIDAFHAALEDRIIAFNRVGGDLNANVLFLAVALLLYESKPQEPERRDQSAGQIN
jgi:hypothetical protein